MKKLAILIATIAVMIITAAYAQGISPPQPNSPAAAGAGAAQADELPWAKLCMRNEQTGNKQICLVQHWGLDPKTGIVLGSASVRVTTDYSLVPPAGVDVEIDDGEPISLQYFLCSDYNCQAHAELTKENFDKVRKGKQMVVSAITMQRQRLVFPVPLTGFGKAYDGPPVDNAKYEEARRQLMEKSRQRQIELANKIEAQQKEQGTKQPLAEAPPQPGAPVPAQPPP